MMKARLAIAATVLLMGMFCVADSTAQEGSASGPAPLLRVIQEDSSGPFRSPSADETAPRQSIRAARPRPVTNPLAPTPAPVPLTAPPSDVTEAAPCLAVHVSGPTHLHVRQKAGFTVTVRNLGLSVAQQVQVRVAMPGAMRLFDSSIQPRRNDAGSLVFDIGDVASGEVREIRLLTVPTEAGALPLNASATFTASLHKTVLVDEPRLSLTCDVGDEVNAGQRLDARLVLTNQGVADLLGLTVHVELPPGWQLRQPDSTLRLATLAAGRAYVLPLTLTVAGEGSMNLSFRVEGEGELVSVLERTVTVRRPKLDVRILGPEVTNPGREEVYEMHVTNSGDVPLDAIDVHCVLSRGWRITVLATPARFDGRRNSLHARIDHLPRGVTDILMFKARAVGSGPQSQSLEARSASGLLARQELRTTIVSEPDEQSSADPPPAPFEPLEVGRLPR